MYKVFIENKPVFFEINPNSQEEQLTIEEIKIGLNNFLTSDFTELYIDLKSETVFFDVFDDHKLIEAAGGLVQNKNKYLFIKRLGVWDIPKGKLEKGESPENGAVREIVEECGIDTPKIKNHLLDTWHTYEMKGKKYLKKTYWYLLKSGGKDKDIKPQEEEDITEAIYLPKKAFDIIKKNTYESIKDVLRALNN